jgi:hypothetical protein
VDEESNVGTDLVRRAARREGCRTPRGTPHVGAGRASVPPGGPGPDAACRSRDHSPQLSQSPSHRKKEETPLSDFVLDFEDELFTEYGNTSNYYSVRKPQELKKSSLHKESLYPSEEAFFKKTTKELVSIRNNE